MKTLCCGCNKLLTEDGIRFHSGNISTELPITKEMTDTITYMWCNDCFIKGLKNKRKVKKKAK